MATAPKKRQIHLWPHPGPQHRLFISPADIILFGGAKAGGKCLRINELVATPYGFKALSDIKLGDRVCNPDGTCARIISVHRNGVKPIFRVSFRDGTFLDCDKDHLWVAWFQPYGKVKDNRSLRLITTNGMIEGIGEGKKFFIPITEPVDFWTTGTKFPLDPYTLGVLLGDGHLRVESVSVFSNDPEVVARIPYEVSQHKQEGGKRGRSYGVKGVLPQVRELGLEGKRAWEKFIPEIYLLADVPRRWELLRGLLDTDGTSAKHKIRFTTVSPKLAEDVKQLVCSLGGTVSMTSSFPTYLHEGVKKTGREAYRLYIKFRDPSQAFHLAAKKNKCLPPQSLYRRVVSIEPIGEEEVGCFQVDNPNGLFLATKNFIVTHNTYGFLMKCAQHIGKAGFKAIFFRPSYPELEREVIPTSHEMFGGVGKYDSKNHRWEFPNEQGKAYIEFGYMEREMDVYRYSGVQYTLICFDESTLFSENQVRTMVSCLRGTVKGVHRQVLLGANPVGPGYGWHYNMFIKNRGKGVYGDACWPSDGKPVGMTTEFIQSRVWDNPTLLKNDPTYPDRLRTQRADIAAALLDGDWNQTISLAFNWSSGVNTVEPFEIPSYATRLVGIDWGKKDKAVAVWLAGTEKQTIAYRDHATTGKDIRPFCYEVIDRSRNAKGELEPIQCVVLSHECFSDKGMGQTQADQFNEVFSRYNIPVIRSNRDPVGRLTFLREYFRITKIPVVGAPNIHDYKYWTKRFETEGAAAFSEFKRISSKTYDEDDLPKLKIFRLSADGHYGCPELINTLPLLQVDIEEPRRLAEGQDDHAYDACFVAGTNVEAEFGPKPIEEIKTGEKVWTRKGLRGVLWSGQTGTRTVIEKFGLTATPNHPIMDLSKGWTQLCEAQNPERITSNTLWMESVSGCTEVKGIPVEESTEKCSGCTSTFGLENMGQSKRDITSTTKTGTHSTTRLKIWKNWKGSLISLATGKLFLWLKERLGLGTARRQKSGIPQKREEDGTVSMGRELGSEERTRGFDVLTAGKVSGQETIDPEFDSAIGTAPRNRSVENTPVPVFNLTIEGENEYYANGILVHNCDYGARYLIMGGTEFPAPVEEYYRRNLDGKIPDSTLAAEMAMEDARKEAEGDYPDLHPIKWR